MNRWLKLSFIGSFIVFSFSCCSKELPKGLIVVKDNPADLGTILQFGSKTHVFKLTNTGNESVLLTKLINGCGCTKSKLDNVSIAPGRSSDVTVELFSDSRVGSFTSKVTILWKTYSGSKSGKIDLILQAKAVSVAVLEPNSIEFSFFEPRDKKKTALLHIKHGSAGVPWDNIVAWDERGNLNVIPLNSETFEIPIIFDSTDRPLGTYRDLIKIKLWNQGKELDHGYQVPITAKLTSDVKITPGPLYLGLMTPESSKSGVIEIVAQSGHPISFISFYSTDKIGFKVKVASMAEARSGPEKVRLSYKIKSPQFSGNASFKLFLKVQSETTTYELMLPVIVYSNNS